LTRQPFAEPSPQAPKEAPRRVPITTDTDRETIMTTAKTDKAVHPAARMYADEYRAGQLSRREFLTRASALGVASAAAYGLIGLEAPPAFAQETPVQGGTLRMNMETHILQVSR